MKLVFAHHSSYIAATEANNTQSHNNNFHNNFICFLIFYHMFFIYFISYSNLHIRQSREDFELPHVKRGMTKWLNSTAPNF